MRKIPPFKLRPEPLNDEARNLPGFKWAPDKVGTRHQLGGEPSFIQEADHPACPSCNSLMTFYAQIDSINDDFLIADCGMIYTFLCFNCNELKSFIQSF